MKLKKFKEKDKKKIGILLFTITCVLLITGVIIYRTFAIFEVQTNQNVIHGRIEDVGDIYFAFYVDNEIQKEMPDRNMGLVLDENASYCGVNGSKIDDIKVSITKDWEIVVNGVSTSRTKCNLYFKKAEKLIDIVKKESIKQDNSGESGIYEVAHDDASITYTTNSTAISNLKQTELRYAGSDPHNYVKLGNDLWRMIGLVNTPEGQRIKLVKNDSIGVYSWDTSDSNVNNGLGVNEWSQSDLMMELNYMYLTSTNGKCYHQNGKTDCNFENNGLKDFNNFIDMVTWNTGGFGSTITVVNVSDSYNFEHGDITGQACTDDEGCNDHETRYTSWLGKIGLMSPSDFGYSASGNETVNRDDCFIYSNLRNSLDCKNSSYLFNSSLASEWLINPYKYGTSQNYNVMAIYYKTNQGMSLSTGVIAANVNVRPSFYLKENVLVKKGNGSHENAFELTINV